MTRSKPAYKMTILMLSEVVNQVEISNKMRPYLEILRDVYCDTAEVLHIVRRKNGRLTCSIFSSKTDNPRRGRKIYKLKLLAISICECNSVTQCDFSLDSDGEKKYIYIYVKNGFIPQPQLGVSLALMKSAVW